MKLRHPMFAVLGVWLVLLSACGRDLANSKMTTNEAMETLSSTTEQENTELVALLQELADNGEIQSSRGAISSSDLSTLSTLLGLLGNGGASGGIGGLVSGLLSSTGGSTSGLKFNLDGVLALLQAAAPIISVIAPQFAPIITAVMTIIPVVIQVIKMFKKPTASLMFAPSFA